MTSPHLLSLELMKDMRQGLFHLLKILLLWLLLFKQYMFFFKKKTFLKKTIDESLGAYVPTIDYVVGVLSAGDACKYIYFLSMFKIL